MNVEFRGRNFVFSGLVCSWVMALATITSMTACATSNEEGALYSPTDNSADVGDIDVNANDSIGIYGSEDRVARWVDGDPEVMYPDRYRARSVLIKGSDEDSSHDRRADNRDPRGWTRRELIKQWGIPAKIQGQRWIYSIPNEKCKGKQSTKNVEFRQDRVKSVRLNQSSHC